MTDKEPRPSVPANTSASVPLPAPISSAQASTGNSGLLGWFKQSIGSPTSRPAALPDRQPLVSKPRARRDSSTLSPDEALNISRANAKPIDIPRLGISEGDAKLHSPPSQTQGNSKYDKLGLITAFSGGPGSF